MAAGEVELIWLLTYLIKISVFLSYLNIGSLKVTINEPEPVNFSDMV